VKVLVSKLRIKRVRERVSLEMMSMNKKERKKEREDL
jgi:hypothetical protein